MKPWLLPSGLQRGIPFIIPDDWSPEQALAVVELLDDLRHIICERYQLQLQELLQEQRCTNVAPASDSIRETDPPF
jgi:hypothetical protein